MAAVGRCSVRALRSGGGHERESDGHRRYRGDGRGDHRSGDAVRGPRPAAGRVREDRRRSSAGARPTPSCTCTRSCGASTARTSRARCTCASSAEKAPKSDRLLAGMGENAGVIQVSDKLAVTFKVESHNHPSFVEPYQGAATGVGGIVRDILAMGARPIAVMDPLRFGAIDHPDTKRVLAGIVGGVGGYGNCLGLPNIGGELVFDAVLPGEPAAQRAVPRRAAGRRSAEQGRQGSGQHRRADGREDRPGRHRRRLDPGQRDLRRGRRAAAARRCRSATRSWRSS